MSRMTHGANQSKTILFWDYYILCRLDAESAMILQRLEYWDGVKNGSNIVAEEINDELIENGKEATQDTEQFVYKSQDELKWELMGLVGTNNLGIKLRILTTELLYVISRNNPLNPTDRKKQYHMAKDYVQIRLDYLTHITTTFQKAGYRMNAVHYAIEDLTKERIYVEDLDITRVVRKLVVLCQQAEIDDIKAIEDREQQKSIPRGTKKPTPYEPVLPKFLRIQLKKDKPLIENIDLNSESPTFNFKEWETLKLKNDQSLKLKNGFPKNKDSIPQNQRISSNYVSSNYNQQIQTSEGDTANISEPKTDTSTSSNSFLLGLSPEARKVHEEWSKMPWFPSNGMGVTVNKTLASQYETAAEYKPTAEIMLKVKEWATSPKVDKKRYYVDKGWCFKFFLNELPAWLSTQPVRTNQQNEPSTDLIPTKPSTISSNNQQNIEALLAKSRQKVEA
jgi:hypothetical protein